MIPTRIDCGDGLTIWRIDWTADSAGEAERWLRFPRSILDRIVTVPDAGKPPSANYDLQVLDAQTQDVLGGLGANRSASATELVNVYAVDTTDGDEGEIMLGGEYLISISAAGSGGRGSVYLVCLAL